jgi:hypothetical protein
VSVGNGGAVACVASFSGVDAPPGVCTSGDGPGVGEVAGLEQAKRKKHVRPRQSAREIIPGEVVQRNSYLNLISPIRESLGDDFSMRFRHSRVGVRMRK